MKSGYYVGKWKITSHDKKEEDVLYCSGELYYQIDIKTNGDIELSPFGGVSKIDGVVKLELKPIKREK